MPFKQAKSSVVLFLQVILCVALSSSILLERSTPASAQPVTLLSGLSQPAGITCNLNGDVFFVEDAGRALKKLPKGSTTATTLWNAPDYLSSCTLDQRTGDIYMTSYWGGTVYKWSPPSTVVTLISGLSYPKGVAVDSGGNVYVIEVGPFQNNTGTLKKLPAGSTAVTTVLSGLNRPNELHVDGYDNLYFVEQAALGVLRKLPPGASSPVTLFSGNITTQAWWVDSKGNVYFITNAGASGPHVLTVLPTGSSSPVTLLSSVPQDARSLTVDSNGNVFFTCYDPGTLVVAYGAGVVSQPSLRVSVSADPGVVMGGLSSTIRATVTTSDGSSPPTVSYSWTANGGSLSSTTSNQVTWTAPVVWSQTTYRVSVTVSASGYTQGSNYVEVTVSPTMLYLLIFLIAVVLLCATFYFGLYRRGTKRREITVPPPTLPAPPKVITPASLPEKNYDVFICHASEDKEAFVRELANALSAKGLKVWYDEFTLTLGDSLRRKIDQGLASSRYGVVVLSESFFRKEWPQKELDGLVAKETGLDKVILPIWHGVTRERVLYFSPILTDRLAVSSDKGVDFVVEEILKAMK